MQINASGRRRDLGLARDGAAALDDRTCWLDKLSVAGDNKSRLDAHQGFERGPLLLDNVTPLRQPDPADWSAR